MNEGAFEQEIERQVAELYEQAMAQIRADVDAKIEEMRSRPTSILDAVGGVPECGS